MGRDLLAFCHTTPIMGAMEKRKPRYALADVKAAFADPATLNQLFVSKQGADALGMDDAAVVATIQALAAADFENWPRTSRQRWKAP